MDNELPLDLQTDGLEDSGQTTRLEQLYLRFPRITERIWTTTTSQSLMDLTLEWLSDREEEVVLTVDGSNVLIETALKHIRNRMMIDESLLCLPVEMQTTKLPSVHERHHSVSSCSSGKKESSSLSLP